jgi:ubiquitin-like domain-containing CTD phosphatase 1
MDDGVCEIKGITLVAKWGKERISLDSLDEKTSIGKVKDLLSERTGVLQKRQKLIGLAVKGRSKIDDNVLIGDLKLKTGKKTDPSAGKIHEFIMMGTKEEQIFVDPSEKDDMPDVVDDFDLDFNAGSSEVSISQISYCKMLPCF